MKLAGQGRDPKARARRAATGISIRNALGMSPKDLAAALNRGFRGYVVPVHVQAKGFDARFRALHLDLESSLVPMRGGRPAGVILISRRGWTSYVAAMGVEPAVRGAGVARRLMERAIQEAQGRGDRSLKLEVIEGNTQAQKFYEKFGFKRMRRLVGYVHDARVPKRARGGPGMELVDPLEFARMALREGEPDLPWMLHPESLAAAGSPVQAFRIGPAWALASGSPAGASFLRGIVVEKKHRRKGHGTELLNALLLAGGAMPLRITPVVPEALAPEFFERMGFQRDPLSQIEMELDLKKT